MKRKQKGDPKKQAHLVELFEQNLQFRTDRVNIQRKVAFCSSKKKFTNETGILIEKFCDRKAPFQIKFQVKKDCYPEVSDIGSLAPLHPVLCLHLSKLNISLVQVTNMIIITLDYNYI